MALAVACGSDDDPASGSNPTAVPANPTATSATAIVPTIAPDSGGASTSPAQGAAFAWTVETVDEGTKPALALKSDGTPYVAYMLEAIPGFVKTASRTGDQWNIDTVTEDYFYGPLDLAIGPDDVPHIAFHDHEDTRFDSAKGDAVHAFLEGDVWKLEIAADDGHDGWDNRIIVDSQNVVHMTGIDPQEFNGDGVEYYRRNADDPNPVSIFSIPEQVRFAGPPESRTRNGKRVYQEAVSNDVAILIWSDDEGCYAACAKLPRDELYALVDSLDFVSIVTRP